MKKIGALEAFLIIVVFIFFAVGFIVAAKWIDEDYELLVRKKQVCHEGFIWSKKAKSTIWKKSNVECVHALEVK